MGECAPSNYIKAIHYYELASNQNNPYAKYQMASMYFEGKSVTTNLEKAFILFQEAAESDYGKAQYSLGIMYKEGLGVAQNHILAQKWFIIASKRYRNAEAFRGKNKLANQMSSEQIALAQDLATDWIETRPPTQFKPIE